MQKMNKLVSVIVPVYGVEAYLPECIDSILSQSYHNLEIILVDDASPDRCGEICDNYAVRDSRIKVIHKENGGAASARNAGLDAATGEYICFVDSDDVVAPQYIQQLYDILHRTRSDVAVCGFTILTKESNDLQPSEPVGIYSGHEYLTLFLKHWSCALIWNKIYRRSVIGAIRFAEGHRIDDEFFTYRLFVNGGRVVVFEDALYYYRQRSSSVMKADETYRERMFSDKVAYLTERYACISNAVPTLADDFLADLLDSFIRFWRQSAKMPLVSSAIRQWILKNMGLIVKSKLGWKFKCIMIYELLLSDPDSKIYQDVPLGDTNAYFE